MKRGKYLIGAGMVVLLLALAAGFVLAQGPEPQDEMAPDEAAAVNAIVPIQGRLTDAGGSPLNGDHSIRARLYDADTGGTVLCEDTDTVTVEDGLFDMKMNWCSASDIDGKSLWLGIAVDGDPEMEPRQPIYPVPYAWSLRPGAIISDTSSSTVLTVSNYGSGTGLHASSESGVALRVAGTGVIQSTASTSIWIPGSAAVVRIGTSGLDILYHGDGIARLDATTDGTKQIVIPLSVPAVLYGQQVQVKGVTFRYKCAGASDSYIDQVKVYRHDGLGNSRTIFDATTDLLCGDATWHSMYYAPSTDNVLSSDDGILTFEVTASMNAAAGSEIWIAGVGVYLDHDG